MFLYISISKLPLNVEERSQNYEVFLHNSKLQLFDTIRSIKHFDSENAVSSLHFLMDAIELSRFALTPEGYLQPNHKEIKRVDLHAVVLDSLRIVTGDLVHNNGALIKVGEDNVLEELKKRHEKQTLYKLAIENGTEINSFPIIIKVIIKDILANATAHAIKGEHLGLFKGKYLVEIVLKMIDEETIQFSVTNHKAIPEEMAKILVNSSYDTDSAAEMPWGVLITSCYCKALGYEIDVKRSSLADIPVTSIVIYFKKRTTYG
jgi:hypothetical protein